MKGAAQVASDLVRTPNQWEAILRRYFCYPPLHSYLTAKVIRDRSTASVALQFTYGAQVTLDPTISQMQTFISELLHAAIPGSYLADYFTSMKRLPSWIARWKREAESRYEANNVLFEGLLDYSKGQLVSRKVLCIFVC